MQSKSPLNQSTAAVHNPNQSLNKYQNSVLSCNYNTHKQEIITQNKESVLI